VTRHSKLNLPDYLPYLVNRVGSAVAARFTEETLAKHDLSIAMWRVLVALHDLGPQRHVDLSDLTSIDVSTLSRLVTRLIHEGLATRARSHNSNREVTVALTAKADRLIAQLIPVARKLERTAMAGLSAAELATTKTALRRMYENLASNDKLARKTPR
jgi:DNA-binding MarR family transcriptional regulator